MKRLWSAGRGCPPTKLHCRSAPQPDRKDCEIGSVIELGHHLSRSAGLKLGLFISTLCNPEQGTELGPTVIASVGTDKRLRY
jgi:hypothetical protein